MKNKKKKKRRKWFFLIIVVAGMVFLFKNKIKMLEAKKENLEPLLKIKEEIFLNENGKIVKIKDTLKLPLLKIDIKGIEEKQGKKLSYLYPCVEIIKIIKENYPEFMDSIEFLDPENYKIMFKNQKIAILGFGNYEEKLNFLFKNYQNIESKIDLRIFTFKKGRF